MSLGTSNANESLHAVIWRRAPKAGFSYRKTVEMAVALGAAQLTKGAHVLVDATEAVIPQACSSTLCPYYVILLYSYWLSSMGPHEFKRCTRFYYLYC